MDKNRLHTYADKVREEQDGLTKTIIAKVTGVTFDGRQEVLRLMSSKTPLMLERDRRNPYDFHAIKVMAEINGEWQQAGFIPKEMSKTLCRHIDLGGELFVSVFKLTGGFVTDEGEIGNLGLEINVSPER